MVCTHIVTGGSAEADEWRRHCGCLKTSDKLKRILKTFPAPPPPTPTIPIFVTPFDTNCISGLCKHSQCNNPSKNRSQVGLSLPAVQPIKTCEDSCYIENKIDSSFCDNKGGSYRSWKVVSELVQLLQLSVTATALALYYLIYCYMQLVYYTLRSAMYFHNADGPMKITIGVVTVTSLVVAFNMILRLERLVVIF